MQAVWLTLGYTVVILGGGSLAWWAFDELLCKPLDRIDWIRFWRRAFWRGRVVWGAIASPLVRVFYAVFMRRMIALDPGEQTITPTTLYYYKGRLRPWTQQ